MKKEDSKDFMKIVHALIPDVLSIYYVRYANGNRTLIREWNPDEHKRYDDWLNLEVGFYSNENCRYDKIIKIIFIYFFYSFAFIFTFMKP